MIRLELGTDELAASRFACSALHEVVASLRVLNDPARYTMHLPWYREVAPRADRLDLRMLRALIVDGAYVPDFIAPPPDRPVTAFEAELTRVAATDPDQVRAEVREAVGVNAPPPVAALLRDPAAGLEIIVGQLRSWFDLAIRDRWPAIRDLLAADIAYRGRQLADGGAHALFSQLHQAVQWRGGGRLELANAYDTSVRLDERGLLLVPSVFSWPSIHVVADEPWQPTLVYPARGTATLWAPSPAAAEELGRLLGRTRAAILHAADAPRTGRDLARLTGVTPGAVSQAVAVLRDAGLVHTARDGRRVVVTRTPLGDGLVAGGTRGARAPGRRQSRPDTPRP